MVHNGVKKYGFEKEDKKKNDRKKNTLKSISHLPRSECDCMKKKMNKKKKDHHDYNTTNMIKIDSFCVVWYCYIKNSNSLGSCIS